MIERPSISDDVHLNFVDSLSNFDSFEDSERILGQRGMQQKEHSDNCHTAVPFELLRIAQKYYSESHSTYNNQYNRN
jgi:hypothetical protein